MTEADIKSVINEAIVKDNISRADTADAILSQELCECIETVTKSLTEQQNAIGVISNIRRQ
ncbi:279_t:CDS:1, partial [Acaulospora colombiana]